MAEGSQVEVTATDPGFPRDAKAWCKSTGNSFISASEEGGLHKVVISKGGTPPAPPQATAPQRNKTLIMFSDDLDRAIATFVLANGAAATGTKVSIFFTFWGLNVIKKEHKPRLKKDFFGKMFSWMLPSSSRKLHLSRMSFFGLGDRLIRHIMRRKNIEQLEDLRRAAQKRRCGVHSLSDDDGHDGNSEGRADRRCHRWWRCHIYAACRAGECEPFHLSR